MSPPCRVCCQIIVSVALRGTRRGSFRLHLISLKNEQTGWRKVDAAQRAANRGQTEAARNILGGLKSEFAAQAGKHITSAVAEILTQDVDSLTNSPRGHARLRLPA